MTARDTGTGSVLEAMIIPALEKGGYSHEAQAHVGDRFGGGRHKVDVLAASVAGETFLVSLKWQQVNGTAEQKVPFEVMCLAATVGDSANPHSKAYLVLGGQGWKLRDFYENAGLDRYLRDCENVVIIGLEDFIALANSGKL